MKCKELQIWDWITDGHGFPMQITNVGDDYAYATFEGNEGDPWEFDDKYCPPEPIEITGDIMRKNNWEEHSYPLPHNLKQYYYVKDEGENHLMWKQGMLAILPNCKKSNDGVYADIVISCKYVHQLQQVLRIAGMTELANNFKI